VEILGSDVNALRESKLTFDMIILSHVLEHFHDPVAALRLIADRMNSDSLLFVEVPNFYGHPSVSYAHAFCFTEKSLRNTLLAAGLMTTGVETLYRNKQIPLYLTCFATKEVNGAKQSGNESEIVTDIIHQREVGKQVYARYTSPNCILKYKGFSFVWRYVPDSVKSVLKLLRKKTVGAG
jgi:2-polyprenyl-3-methyl-5-hydroxy-6-metoxy-1,4-benzoquinol methylase